MRWRPIVGVLAVALLLLFIVVLVIQTVFPPRVHAKQDIRSSCLRRIQYAAEVYYAKNLESPTTGEEAVAELPEDERGELERNWKVAASDEAPLNNVRVTDNHTTKNDHDSRYSVEVDVYSETDIVAQDRQFIVRKVKQ